MRRLRWLALAALGAFFVPASLIAQELGTVTGQVVSQATQQPIAGATILVQGSQLRGVTDAQGRYRIEGVPTGQRTVSANQLGFGVQNRQVTVRAGAVATVDFSLSPATAVELEGIVVNAVTGEEERVREIGNAVGRIDVDDVELASVNNAAAMLQGRVAGLNVQSVSGTTGTAQRIRIRGANSLSLSNEPLIIVDGIRFDNTISGGYLAGQESSRLNDLNMADIQSVEVLKGPAASGLYGTAAANGVILITTKKGTTGAPRFNFYTEGGIVREENEYPNNFAGRTAAGAPCFAAPTINRFFRATPAGCEVAEIRTFNPLEDPRTTPFVDGERYKLGGSVSGGSENVTYFLSGDFEREDGVYKPNDLVKSNLRANFRALVTDNLTLTASTGWIQREFSQPSNDNSILSPIINGLLGTAVVDEATVSAETYDYGFLRRLGGGNLPDKVNRIFDTSNTNRFVGSLNATWQPIPWLSVNSSAGLDVWNEFDHIFLSPGVAPIAPSWTIGWARRVRGTNQNYTLNGAAIATFGLTPDVNSTTTVGFDYNNEIYRNIAAFGAGITPGTRSLRGTSSLFEVDERNVQNITIGGFAQQQFAWRDRVFLSGAIRGDDNSAFGQDFGFIVYPSASLSWVVSDEQFFPQTNWLTSFRLRTSYGQSGLRPSFRNAQTFFAPAVVVRNSVEQPAVRIGGAGNPDLEPERTTELEAGFDAGLLGDRLALEFTAFTKESEDALIQRDLPPSLGLTAFRFENLGSVRNSGIELALDGRLVDTRPFKWSARVSFSTLDNEIQELGEGISPIIFNRGNQRHQAGFPAGAFFQPTLTFEDADGDGVIDLNEISVGDSAEFIGPSLPTRNGSLSTDLTFFDVLRISTLFDGSGGNYQLNYNEQFRCLFGVIYLDRGCRAQWDPAAPPEAQAAWLGNIFGERRRTTTAGFIEEADFIRWRELSFTLTPPQRWVERIANVNDLSLTVAGRNLGLFTDYTGLSPEANEAGASANFTQGEFNTQPPVRYWTVRLNFNF